MRITESAKYSGVRIQFDLVCDECGDVDNWIAVRVGEYRREIKNFKKAMRLEGWRIGNGSGKKCLCPMCNKNEIRGITTKCE